MHTFNKVLLLVAILFTYSISSAQNNVLGTWILQSKDHIFGPEYANALPKQMRINQQADSLILESINIGGNGQDVNSRQAVPMNGQPLTMTSLATKRKYIKSLQWSADKKSLVLTIVIYIPSNPDVVDFTRVETWSLSPDGKQLNISKKSIETRSETWEAKGVFIKNDISN